MRLGIRSLFFVPILGLVVAASALGDVPSPTLVGPIPANVAPGDPSHDYPYFTPVADLSGFGYMEEEYFIEGTASRYSTPSLLTGSVISSGHPYKTRLVVRRPINKRRANGIVLFEWQNVSAGYELDAHWGPSWPHLVMNGYTWVGISAQRVGVLAGGDQRLRRHAADVEAVAAHLAFLDQHHRHAERGGRGGDRQAAGAGADDAEIGRELLGHASVRRARRAPRANALHDDRNERGAAEHHQRADQLRRDRRLEVEIERAVRAARRET
jgi:hypothetical protein